MTSRDAHAARIYKEELSRTEQDVLDFLQGRGKGASLQEIADAVSKHKSTISKIVSGLELEGLVTKKRKGNTTTVFWVGGVPALEYELEQATERHIQASFLAEHYDSLIVNPFSIFSVLFENNYWEVVMNLQEGLNDVELSQKVGNAIPLDSVRRVLVIADAHNIIQISRIREPSGNDVVKLFEPLYKIKNVNKEFKDYLIIIRGLASAMSFRIEGKTATDYSHAYDPLLEIIIPKFLALRDKMTSGPNHEENEILQNVINNYDFAPDLSRYYKNENWKKRVKDSKNLVIDGKTDHVLITKTLKENYRNSLK